MVIRGRSMPDLCPNVTLACARSHNGRSREASWQFELRPAPWRKDTWLDQESRLPRNGQGHLTDAVPSIQKFIGTS